MKSRLIFPIALICAIFIGCDKDDIKKREAEAFSSFEGKLSFSDATFAYLNDGSIHIRFHHYVSDSDISLEIIFKNIEPVEGMTNLVFYKVGGGLERGKPTSYMNVIVDGDGLGETYFTDSTAILENTLTIDCITKNKISGSFQVSYELDDHGNTKFAPWIPDKFSLTEGVFDARD